jgi:hypothetical protein
VPGRLHLHRSELTAVESGVAARPTSLRPLALTAFVIGAAWLLAASSHAAGIARTDDWAFARVAITLHQTGHVHLVGWAQMSLLGLVVWAQPWLALFGAHQWVLDLSASVLVGAGLLAAYRLARIVAGPAAALIVVGTVAAAPGFVRDAGSFMTDGPAFSVGTFALLAGLSAATAEGRRRWILELACLAAGWWAFSIRELALAAPVAVLAARWLGEPRRRRVLTGQLLALAGGCAAFGAWRSSLPGRQPFSGRPPPFTIGELTVGVVFTTCLLLVPVLAATAPGWWAARRPMARGIGMAVGAALALVPIAYAPGSWNRRYQWLTGDYLDPRGLNGNKLLLGSRPRVLPPLGWACVEVLAVVAGIVVMGLLAEAVAGALGSRDTQPRRSLVARAASAPLARRVLVAHLALLFVLLLGAIVTNGATFDRYLWPAVLSGGILLLDRYPPRPLEQWHPAASQVALVVITAFTLVTLLVTLNSDAFDGVRWRVAQGVAGRGVAGQGVTGQGVAGQGAGQGVAGQGIDAGFEWVGAHATGVADANASGDGTRPYWVAMVGHPAACVELSASTLSDPGLVLVRTVRWRTWLVFGTARLFEYRRPSACG